MPRKIKIVTTISVIDPDSHLPVEVVIYKDVKSGGIFGVDASFVETEEPVYCPFVKGKGAEVDIDEAEAATMNEQPYEIKMYESRDAFENRRPFDILDYDNKKDALRDFKSFKEYTEYNGLKIEVMKLQSKDREDIEIYTNEK